MKDKSNYKIKGQSTHRLSSKLNVQFFGKPKHGETRAFIPNGKPIVVINDLSKLFSL